MCDFHQCKGSNGSLPKPIQGVQSPFLVAKHLEKRSSTASWRLQPIWKIFVKNGVILKIKNSFGLNISENLWNDHPTLLTTNLLEAWKRSGWEVLVHMLGNLFPRRNECSIPSFSFLATKQWSRVIPTQTTNFKKAKKKSYPCMCIKFHPPGNGQIHDPCSTGQSLVQMDLGFRLGACLLFVVIFLPFHIEFGVFYPPKTNKYPLKREHFKNRSSLATTIFQGDRLVFRGECISKHILPLPSCNRRSSRQASGLLGRTVVRRAGYISCTWTAVMMKGLQNGPYNCYRWNELEWNVAPRNDPRKKW